MPPVPTLSGILTDAQQAGVGVDKAVAAVTTAAAKTPAPAPLMGVVGCAPGLRHSFSLVLGWAGVWRYGGVVVPVEAVVV